MPAPQAGPMPATADPTLREDFLAAMSRAAQTVNVVTTDGPLGRAGVTVSAMTSVSADTPNPTLLVCVNQSASAAAPILGNGRIVVNILRDDQAPVADAFAGRTGQDQEARFAATGWVAMPSGLPAVKGALVSFDCRIATTTLIGTHHVLFAEVEHVHLGQTGRPLIYAHRAYHIAARLEPPAL